MARLLIVDDNVELVENLAEIWEDDGHAVRVAHDVKTAVAALDQERPDLVVTDVRLPDGNGLDVLVHAKQRYAGVPVIVISGYPDPDTTSRAHARGAVAVLTKPFDLGELTDVIERLTKAARGILVVDDDPDLIANWCEVLQTEGYLPHPAGTIERARSLAASVEYDVAVIDVRLPDGCGREFGEALQASNDKQAVIYVTGFADGLAAIEDRAVTRSFTKPVAPDRLLAAIGEMSESG